VHRHSVPLSLNQLDLLDGVVDVFSPITQLTVIGHRDDILSRNYIDSLNQVIVSFVRGLLNREFLRPNVPLDQVTSVGSSDNNRRFIGVESTSSDLRLTLESDFWI